MFPTDNSDEAGIEQPQGADPAIARVGTLLAETLIHLLLEKGLLTRSDALGIVGTVVQIEQGTLHEAEVSLPEDSASLRLLRRMQASFEALTELAPSPRIDGENVIHLRPRLHGDGSESPREN